MEVLADLVIAAVFKTVGPYEKHAVGGFDSHALPLFVSRPNRSGWPEAVRQALSSDSGLHCHLGKDRHGLRPKGWCLWRRDRNWDRVEPSLELDPSDRPTPTWGWL